MRVLRIVTVAVLALLVTATPATAHVGVLPATAPAGEVVQLTFRVPNERTATATVRLQLQLPVDFEQVEPGAVAGWQHRVEGDVVTWEGGRIEPGARGEFPLRVGPLPAGAPLVFPAVQTYDDGEVVRWIDDDGDHPAAVLQVTGDGAPAPTTTTLHEGAAPATTATTEPATTTTTGVPPDAVVEEDDDDGVPAGLLAVGGLVLLALVVGAAVVVRNRRRA